MLFITTLLVSIIITISVMPYARELALKMRALDKPNHRKLHEHVTPRCGGLAMAMGAFVPVILWAPRTHFVKGLLLGGLIVVVFGLADDIEDLKPSVKLLGQTLAALSIILIGGLKINDLGDFWTSGAVLPDWAAIPLTVFVIVGVTNAANLSDGLDGLAGGIALLILLCIGYLGVVQKEWVIAMIAIAVGGSILGFLRFNSYPAQVFMGDAGSQMLGFVAVVLAIKMAQQSPGVSVILPLIIFGISILDTVTVMIKRLAERRSPFSADRNHLHYKLMAIGLFHAEAVFTIYLAQALLIVFAITFYGSNDWFLLTAYLLFAFSVLGAFHVFDKTGYLAGRGQFLQTVKDRFRALRDRGKIIKFSFGFVKVGLPALLIFNALFKPNENSVNLVLSGSFLFLLLLAWFANKKVLNRISTIAFYLFTPFIIFKCDVSLYSSNLGHVVISLYNALYLLLLASVLLTIKLTRRSQGFRSSTLDFLVIFVILLIANLPDTAIEGHLMGLVAVKTVILYYSYEVLVGEMRRESVRFTVSAAAYIFGFIGLVTFAAAFVEMGG